MKKKLFIIFLLTVGFFLFAQLVSNEFIVISNINKNEVFQLGDPLAKVVNQCPDLFLRGKKEYSNITFTEYEGNGIIFSVSAYDESEIDANILMITVFKNTYSTKRGITIGSSKEHVLSKYGTPDFVHENSFFIFTANMRYDN